MTVRRLARLTVLSSTLLLSSVTGLAAHAADSCGSGSLFAVATAGSIDGSDPDQWWQTPSVGITTITLTPSGNLDLDVRDANCGTFCTSAQPGTTVESCTVTYTGVLNIHVHLSDLDAEYTLTAVPGPSLSPSPGLPSPACRDGVDNDFDGQMDYPADSDCDGPNDQTEVGSPPPPSCSSVGGVPVCAEVTPGTEVVEQPLAVVEPSGAGTHHVAGAVDIYRFALATGGTATVPCVVLGADAVSGNPCLLAGGTFVSRLASLVDQDAGEPSVEPGESVATVRVCAATVTLTVAGIGVEDFPAFSLC